MPERIEIAYNHLLIYCRNLEERSSNLVLFKLNHKSSVGVLKLEGVLESGRFKASYSRQITDALSLNSESEIDFSIVFPGFRTIYFKVTDEIRLELKTDIPKLLDGISIKVEGLPLRNSQGVIVSHFSEV
jgi:hypothetical protein